jgi:hypothetical protein
MSSMHSNVEMSHGYQQVSEIHNSQISPAYPTNNMHHKYSLPHQQLSPVKSKLE